MVEEVPDCREGSNPYDTVVVGTVDAAAAGAGARDPPLELTSP